MNDDQNYGFDVCGFLHLKKILNDEELAACSRAFSQPKGTPSNSNRILAEDSTLTVCIPHIKISWGLD